MHPDRTQYLPAAYESLRGQETPPGWSWHWVVYQDGPGDAARRALPEDERITVVAGRSSGIAAARNLALARVVSAEACKVLDADDQLTAGALARDLTVLMANPDVAWTVSAALDLQPDGSLVEIVDQPPSGRLSRGTVLQHWAPRNRLPVHPATLCVRTSELLAVGGWMALPASEDTGLLMALDATSDGWFIRTPGLLYRQWAGQVTKQATHADHEERTARTMLIAARARILANGSRTADPAPLHQPAL